MARQPLGGRPNKAALSRMKLGTVVVSIAAFAGSLGAVAYLNPGIKVTTAQPTTSVVSFNNTGTSTGSNRFSSRQSTSAAPLVRTRGS